MTTYIYIAARTPWVISGNIWKFVYWHLSNSPKMKGKKEHKLPANLVSQECIMKKCYILRPYNIFQYL